MDLSVNTRMVADRITEIHQLVSFAIACFRLCLQSGLLWNLYLGLRRGRHLSLIGEVWLVDPHAPVNKEIVLIIWNRARRGLFVWNPTVQAVGRHGGEGFSLLVVIIGRSSVLKSLLCQRSIILTKAGKVVPRLKLLALPGLIVVVVVAGPGGCGQHSLLRFTADKIINVIIRHLHGRKVREASARSRNSLSGVRPPAGLGGGLRSAPASRGGCLHGRSGCAGRHSCWLWW